MSSPLFKSDLQRKIRISGYPLVLDNLKLNHWPTHTLSGLLVRSLSFRFFLFRHFTSTMPLLMLNSCSLNKNSRNAIKVTTIVVEPGEKRLLYEERVTTWCVAGLRVSSGILTPLKVHTVPTE